MTARTDRRAAPLLILHIPKTAGVSLGWVAERQYPAGELVSIYPGRDEQFDAFVARPRMPAALIGHFRFGLHERLPSGGRYVTFLRDPVEQVVSHFNYLAANPATEHGSQIGLRDTLADFLAHPWARNLQTQFVCGWQADEVAAAPEAALERALAAIDAHFLGVGLVERFEESVRALAPALGWRRTRVPRMNRTPLGPRAVRRRTLDPQLERAIEDANALDRRLYAIVRERFERELAPQAPRRWQPAPAQWLARYFGHSR